MKTMLLTKGMVALVDDEDFESLSHHKWSALKSPNGFYAVRQFRKNGKQNFVYMHRQILHPSKKHSVDHIDHDSLNNQKSNLRSCVHSQNLKNMTIHKDNHSGFKGVSWHGAMKKWNSQIVCGKVKIQRFFTSKSEAAGFYDSCAIKLHGEFALTNKMMGLLN